MRRHIQLSIQEPVSTPIDANLKLGVGEDSSGRIRRLIRDYSETTFLFKSV